MSITEIEECVERLRNGVLDLTDLQKLERLRVEQLLPQLEDAYPVQFLELRQRSRHEIGLGQRLRESKRWPTKVLRQCLLITMESGMITTLAVMTQLRFRPAHANGAAFELTCGAGYSVYRDPDGWKIKLLQERTVTLSEENLVKRGWLLGSLKMPTASAEE